MDILNFFAERYNYWIFITLMMMGLYIVISRGNLIKKLIGLNVFQTSVFIYYISIGKIAGGTAPIYVAGDMESRAHGGGHGAENGGGHSAPGADGADALPGKDALGAGALHADDMPHGDFELAGNDLATLTGNAQGAHAPALHAAPDAGAPIAGAPDSSGANDILAAPALKIEEHAIAAADAVKEVAHQAGDVVYSNPLPHVLILTAIVVGIATTAVGLALVVRIREAYGTIEEDELESADNVAEFGAARAQEAVA
ncbi:MAG: cation:proton antiporter subunit C [Parvularculaceae bacterium]|nr:cation:proton antiporter subunit C [Parvularculaceae bacterium]